ncbi:alkaline phosphatase [Virgibacillus sp. FSP13]
MFKGKLSKKIAPLALSSGLVLSSFAGIGTTKVSAAEKMDGEIENIIFMIGDGMGPAALTAHRYMEDDDLSTSLMDDMAFDPYFVGMQSTFPEDDDENITDSAAGATAMATGIKSYNGAVSVDNDKKDVKTVLERAKEVGKATGMVATVQLNHATPASYGAHAVERHNYNEIADEYYDELINGEHKIDVLLGGGTDYFIREDRNLVKEFKSDGYSYVTNREELLNDNNEQILGLFAPVALPMMIDRTEDIPSLAEMTNASIERLNRDEDGFFLMVEGSQIDWAEHDNDIVGAMSEMKDFAEAFKTAIEFAKNDGHTLVVATADHSTGGLTIGREHDYVWHPEVIKSVKHSPDYISEQIVEGANVEAALTENIDLDLTNEEIQSVIDAKESANPDEALDNISSAIKKIIDIRSATGWTTSGHTGVDVPVYAYGPGKEMFAGKIDNTDQAKNIFKILNEEETEADYTDVKPGDSHYEGIQWLTEKGIKGYQDGSFGVSNDLTRPHAAIMFTKALELDVPSAEEVEKYFDDIDANDQYAKFIAAVGKAGVFNGSNGNFLPEKDLTREQMATTLVNAFDLESNGKNVDVNLDNVSDSHKANVQILADLGITNQLEDFHPKDAVTRGQFATFLYLSR